VLRGLAIGSVLEEIKDDATRQLLATALTVFLLLAIGGFSFFQLGGDLGLLTAEGFKLIGGFQAWHGMTIQG